MNYKFVVKDENYEDYASGRVLFNQHGTTSFPVRLASEIFQRCKDILETGGVSSPYSVYDPCCGGAYLLATIGFLHGDKISHIFASDVDENIIPLAIRNLSLLSLTGLNGRIEQINKMIAEYGKESHKEALRSSANMQDMVLKRGNSIFTKCFVHDITKESGSVIELNSINMLIVDLPYGNIVNWSNNLDENNAIGMLLNNVLSKLAINSVVAIISKKRVSVKHDAYKRVEHFSIGKRQVTFMQPIF